MTAFSGVTTAHGALLNPEGMSSTLSGFSLDPCALALMGYRSDGLGPVTRVVPTVYPQSVLVARTSRGIDQEFFGHIVVAPRSLDLGLVLTAKLFTIGVWNLTGYDQRLVSWSITGLDGVTVTNPDGSPVQFGAGAYRSYQVTAGASGSATITGSISFNFMGSWTGLNVTVSGSRLVVFSFEPNWREAPTESLEWLTDVLSAYDDTEQRLALRQDPRRALRYLFTFDSQNKVNLFQGQLWGWQQRVWVVPVWMDWRPLGAALPAGSTAIPTSTPLRDYGTGNMAMIWRDYLNWEVVEIDTLTAGTLTLKKPTTGSWTAMDRIMPIRLGRLSKSVPIARPTSMLAEATLQFTLEVGTAVGPNRLGTSTWLQFQGLDVLTLPPNTAPGDLDEAYERNFDTVDFAKGAWAVNDHATGPVVDRPYSWLLENRQASMNFLAFLEVRKGRAIPFWMPTWSKDLEQVQNMGSADLNIVVKNIGYTRYIKNHPNRSAVIFYPDNGSTPIVKTITGSAEGAGNTEILSMDTPFGAVKKPSDFKAISFLTYCRLDQDAFEITWHSDAIAEVTFRVREVLQ